MEYDGPVSFFMLGKFRIPVKVGRPDIFADIIPVFLSHSRQTQGQYHKLGGDIQTEMAGRCRE
jgi:hypothetical protein